METQTNTRPHRTQTAWKPKRPPKLSPPAAANLPGRPNSPNTPKSVCDVNRIGKENPWRVCLVHSGDGCLLSQALVLFPRSRPPSSKQRLQPKRTEKIPNSQLLPANHALAALFHPVFKSTEVEGAQATAVKGWWKSWFVIQGALKCAVLAERPEQRPWTGLFYLSYQSAAHRQAAQAPPSAAFSPHNRLDTQKKHRPPQSCLITVHHHSLL